MHEKIHLPKLKSAVERTGASYRKKYLRSKDFSFGTFESESVRHLLEQDSP